MKRIIFVTIYSICLVFSSAVYAQINSPLNTKKISSTKVSNLSIAIPIKKIDENKMKGILDKDLPESALTDIKVPASYMNKQSQKKWKITPDRAFGRGSLGFSFLSGWLWRDFFVLERDFSESGWDENRRRPAIAFVGFIHFDAKYNKEYLIRIISAVPVNSHSYIKTAVGSVNGKVYPSDRNTFLILVKASEAGESGIAISALHHEGRDERYPGDFMIKEILIDEL